MRKNQSHVLLSNESVLIEVVTRKDLGIKRSSLNSMLNCTTNKQLAPSPMLHLHIECQFDLGFNIGIVNFEKSMHELLQIDVAVGIEIQHCEEPFTYDAWKLRVLK